MREALRSEWRKVASTRMWWLLAIVLAGYMAFLGVVLGFSLLAEPLAMGGSAPEEPLDAGQVALTLATLAVTIGYVFPLAIGTLSMTGEFRHRTITATFLAQPRRGVVAGAKAIIGAAVGLGYGVIGVLGGILGGLPALIAHDEAGALADGAVARAALFSALAMAIWAAIGVGVGTLIPNQVAAVVAILAFTQFVEPILRIGLGAVDALAGAQKFLPGAAAEALAGSSLYSTTGMLDLLSRAGGALVLAAYALAIGALGVATTLRRDIG